MSPQLKALIEMARTRPPMTADEISQQRLSWMIGMKPWNSPLTDEEWRAVCVEVWKRHHKETPCPATTLTLKR